MVALKTRSTARLGSQAHQKSDPWPLDGNLEERGFEWLWFGGLFSAVPVLVSMLLGVSGGGWEVGTMGRKAEFPFLSVIIPLFSSLQCLNWSTKGECPHLQWV